jgi:hypothetical protein
VSLTRFGGLWEWEREANLGIVEGRQRRPRLVSTRQTLRVRETNG